MKEIFSILTLLSAAAYSSTVLAQGTIAFNNSSTSLVMRETYYGLQPVPKGQGFVQLLYAPGGTAYNRTSLFYMIANNPGWILGPITPIAPVDGRFDGGIITLAGIAAGANVSYALLGWTGNYLSYDRALASGAMVDASTTPFTMATGGVDPLIPPPSLSTTFTGLTITYIPEPSIISLASLGCVLFLLRCRRSEIPCKGDDARRS